MDSQPEFFEELPSATSPRREFAEFRVGQKIIQIPCSVWKDGRIRADVSKYGAGEVVSRNATNLQDRVVEILREHFGAIVEAVYLDLARAGRPKASKPRSSNKLAALQQPTAAVVPKRHINPFVKDVWNFSKAPQWLLVRREPSLAEKLVYTRLTYAPREKEEEKICKKDIELGAIFELNQAKLANELGVRRECVCGALKSLRKRGLIDYIGNQGAKGCIRFLWHPWMPETCALNTQVSIPELVRLDNRSCAPAAQPVVRFSHNSCAQKQQVSPGAEKREKQQREERRGSLSSYW